MIPARSPRLEVFEPLCLDGISGSEDLGAQVQALLRSNALLFASCVSAVNLR